MLSHNRDLLILQRYEQLLFCDVQLPNQRPAMEQELDTVGLLCLQLFVS